MKLSTLEHFSERRITCVALVLIILLIGVAYGGSLRNGFIWDDETFIVQNKYVHDLSLWRDYIFTAESVSNVPQLSQMYRPVQTFSFALDYFIWGDWAGGFHLSSLLLHAAVCAAIIFVFRSIFGILPAVAAALIFAVHPALSEGALSLASRGNQLYTFFGLISLGFFINSRKLFDPKHIAAILAAVLSLFSKEPAIALIVLFPIVQGVFNRPWNLFEKRSIILHLPLLAAAVFFMIMRASVVDTSSSMGFWGGSLWNTLLMQSRVFVKYLRLLIWPFQLQGRYVIRLSAFPDLASISAVCANLILLAAAIFFWRRGGNGKKLAFAVAWFYISLAPVSNIIPIPGSMMGERFIYFTFAAVIPALFSVFWDTRNENFRLVLIAGCALLFVPWLITDVRRTDVWKDNRSFFTLASKQDPDNAVQIRMAMEELKSGDPYPAIVRLRKVLLTEDPKASSQERAVPHYWYGRALLSAGMPKEAHKEFLTTLSMRPRDREGVVSYLAESAALAGDLKEARAILEKEVDASPSNDSAWNGLGNVLLMSGDVTGAANCYRTALKSNPKNSEAAANLRNILEKTGRTAEPPQTNYLSR